MTSRYLDKPLRTEAQAIAARAPVWVDHIPPVTPPTPLQGPLKRKADLHWLKQLARQRSKGLTFELYLFGCDEMRRLDLDAPPGKPNPRNPSGLILCASSGTDFDIITDPTYPRTGP